MGIETSSRRSLLRSVVGVGAIGIAGCTGSTDDDDDSADGNETDAADGGDDDPPELPNIERQVIERDRAAVTFVSRELTGRAVTTDFRWTDPVDPDLLGVWAAENEAIVFTDQREFAWILGNDEYPGMYFADPEDQAIRLIFDDGSEQQFGYETADVMGATVLRCFDGDEVVFEYQLDEKRTDERQPVQRAEDMGIVESLGDVDPLVDELQARSRGSGLIVSSEGYIVSNAHVVVEDSPRETLLVSFAADLTRALREGLQGDDQLSTEEANRIEAIFFDQMWDHVTEHTTIEDVQTDIGVLYGRATPDDDVTVNSWDAEIVRTGSFTSEEDDEWTVGRDVSLLSVDETDLPTVPLGDADDVATGDDIFVIGYPNIGVEAVFGERSMTLEPTLTRGVVSARRELATGLNSIQTDAALNGGNSGGPMYNSDGEVVGIATFKANDPRIDDVSFGLPIEAARGFMVEAGAENDVGETHRAYVDGLDAYWRGDCETATARMNEVLNQSPNHPYAQNFIDDCESGEAPGQES